ncbi:MAG: hypothetical protein PHT48_09630 [Dechloromonas sp.]|nr:hypothetical protein [Dechloromonas sp.]
MKSKEQVTLDKIYITAAKNAAEQFDYGQTISKRWLMNQFAIEEPEHGTRKDFEAFAFEYLQNVEGFKDEMLKTHRMQLANVRGKGYMILEPKQQTDFAMTRLKDQVRTEIKKAVDTLSYINEGLLTSEEIKHRDEAQGKIAAISAFHKIKRIA